MLKTRGAGGPGKIQWRTLTQETFPAEGQTVDFQLPAAKDTPTETTVTLPAESLQHLRLYLPAQQAPVILDQVTFQGR